MRLIRSSANSLLRLANDRAKIAGAVDSIGLKRQFRDLTKPPSLGGGMKKAGIALIAFPDPITGVPGVALLASSLVMRGREPANLDGLAQEARKITREIRALSL